MARAMFCGTFDTSGPTSLSTYIKLNRMQNERMEPGENTRFEEVGKKVDGICALYEIYRELDVEGSIVRITTCESGIS